MGPENAEQGPGGRGAEPLERTGLGSVGAGAGGELGRRDLGYEL